MDYINKKETFFISLFLCSIGSPCKPDKPSIPMPGDNAKAINPWPGEGLARPWVLGYSEFEET
jgi:hypothetical protein